MSLPSTDISTDLVSSGIGLASHDVGTLCAKAKTGGALLNDSSFALAFRTYQNNNNAPSDIDYGELIPGSEPYWNIWSPNSPGEFYFDDTGLTMPMLRFRLRNTTQPSYVPSKNDYNYILDNFRNYDASVTKPAITNMNITNVGGYIRFRCNVWYGEYDWNLILSTLSGSELGARIFIVNQLTNITVATLDLNSMTTAGLGGDYEFDFQTTVNYNGTYRFILVPSKWIFNSGTSKMDYLNGADLSRLLVHPTFDGRTHTASYFIINAIGFHIANTTYSLAHGGIGISFMYPTTYGGQPNNVVESVDISFDIFDTYTGLSVYNGVMATAIAILQSDEFFNDIFSNLPASYNTQDQRITINIYQSTI